MGYLIVWRIDLQKPAELSVLTAAFAAVSNQFESYIRREFPPLRGAAQLLVKDIRQGSIVIELLPVIQPLLSQMDNALIVDGFVQRFGGLLTKYISGDKDDTATKSTIKDLLNAVTLIANDPDGKSAIASVEYHSTKTTERLTMQFETPGARTAKDTLQVQHATLDLPAFELFENRLLMFVQTSIRPTETGSRTQLQAIVESIHSRPLPVKFETDLARERIQAEIRDDEKNVYKKGFYVDFYLEKVRTKPAVYRITAVRDIVELVVDDC